MIRPFVTICALVLSAGLLSACGPDEEEAANTAEETTQEETAQGDVTTETDVTAETDAAGDEVVEEDTVEMAEADDAPAADTAETPATDDAAAAPEPEAAAGDETEADTEAAAGGDAAASGGDKSPQEVVESTEKGQLKNPYADDPKSVAEAGHKLYMGFGCNGCHGGTGGGGMGPPLTNSVWVYGSDDDTLFRFITLGSDQYQKTYDAARKGSENVVGPMPPMGGANINSADDLWKVISWIRTINPESGGGGATGAPKAPEFD